jgi:hypothetical protein
LSRSSTAIIISGSTRVETEVLPSAPVASFCPAARKASSSTGTRLWMNFVVSARSCVESVSWNISMPVWRAKSACSGRSFQTN